MKNKATLKQIHEFIASEPLAVAGVSRNPGKFGYKAFKELKDKGMKVIPVNPFAEEIDSIKVFNNIKSLPEEVRGLIIFTRKEETVGVIREAKEKGLKQIWIQQTSDSKEAISELAGSDINFITGECILMHYKPDSVHKFHKAIKKFFGFFPK
jgi:predicted CoA-binding protein